MQDCRKMKNLKDFHACYHTFTNNILSLSGNAASKKYRRYRTYECEYHDEYLHSTSKRSFAELLNKGIHKEIKTVPRSD